jgi:hypothetical protein
MNRTLSCVTVMTLLLAAVTICIKHTIESSGQLANFVLAMLLSFEGIVAGALIASAATLLRKRFARQKKPVSRRPIAEVARA